MAGIKLQKRKNDFFVSYGRDDRVRVTSLVDFLTGVCGLEIWLDANDGNASTRSSELLGEAIGNARGALFCLSAAWKSSSWCKDEYDVALVERRTQEGFEIVCLRLDDVVPPVWVNVSQIIDLRVPSPEAMARLLQSLASDVPHRFDNADDVYLAAPWSRPSPLARETLEVLRQPGWRLVGDSPNYKHLGEKRIEAIQRTTRGVIALLPNDPSQPDHATSPHILDEARLALDIGKPLLLLAETGVVPPQDVVQRAFRGTAFPVGSQPTIAEILEDFGDVLEHQAHDDSGAFTFFASSLRDNPSESADIVSVVERASNMECVRGARLTGDNVQTSIIDLIRRAATVIADVSDDHKNTLIEAGIALGAGTRLKLICREPPAGEPLKKRFMFEGLEQFWYRTPEDRLGLCYYFARQLRRRVYVRR